MKFIRRQARHDWDQIRNILDWMWEHTEICTAAIVGIPVIGLAIMEAICYMELSQFNAIAATLIK